MDWMNRGQQRPGHTANQQASNTPASHSVSAPAAAHKQGGVTRKLSDMKVATLTMFVSIAILLVALIGIVVLSGNQSTAGGEKSVNSEQMQAVFINGGQVYFGKIRDLNGKFVHLSDIYYLRVNQQVQPEQGQQAQPTDDGVSLVKLGCELHGPEDQMFINREQVVFWENLKPDGQVAKAVEEYVKQNPEGQKCEGGQDQSENNGGTPAPAQNGGNNPGSNNEESNTNNTPVPTGNREQENQ